MNVHYPPADSSVAIARPLPMCSITRSAASCVMPSTASELIQSGRRDGARGPKALISAFLRFGPMPGISSSTDWKARFAAHLAVVGDGEAMRLVAHALQQVQPLRATRQHQRLLLAHQINLLIGADGAVVLLGDADDRHANRQRRNHL